MARIIGEGLSYNDVLIVPKYNKIRSRTEVSLKTQVTLNHHLDMPLIAANMDTICESEMAIAFGRVGGLGVIHRFLSSENQAEEVRKVKKLELICAAAIGIKDYEGRVEKLYGAGVDILVLDIAHGHSKFAGKTLDWIKQNYPSIDVMVGNVATKDAAHYFLSKNADAIKVGIGPGSMCTTRLMTGVGIPQITAIIDCYEETQNRIPLCADGGIRQPGDVAKAIGAGANTVMIGGIISGTNETPGIVIQDSYGKKFKEYRGMASYDATIKRLELDGRKHDEVISVEGEKTNVELKGGLLKK